MNRPGARLRNLAFMGLIGLLMLMAFLSDVFLTPHGYIEYPFYIVPILVAAVALTPRSVWIVTVVAVVLVLINSLHQGTPHLVWPFGTAGLAITGYLAYQLSDTRRRLNRHAQALESTNQQLAETQQQLQTFVASVAHELGQPITTIVGYTQLMQRRLSDVMGPSEQTALGAIAEATKRMQRITADLREAAMIGAGEFVVHPAEMDLAATVRQMVEAEGLTAADHPVLLEAPESLPGRWDRARMQQVVNNLLSNALKYSPPGTRVRVTLRREDDEAILAVSDQGPGIAAEEQAHLFRPFSRLESAGGVPGTGLGLFITQRIVEAHGGRIRIESAPGAGTTFVVSLPLVPALDLAVV